MVPTFIRLFLLFLWFFGSPSTTLSMCVPVCVYVCTFSHTMFIEKYEDQLHPYAEEEEFDEFDDGKVGGLQLTRSFNHVMRRTS